MTREEKLEAIYKEMANKELTFGCKITTNEYNGDEFRVANSDLLAIKEGEAYRTVGCDCCSEDLSIKEIIGHPVMIGDVIDYTGEKKIDIVWSDSSCAIDIRDGENSLNLFNLWGNKRTPIESQYDECIDYVYSLIQK